ncbi:MAG: GNAT family N-acetyltransferase [Ekhidna sp.]
MKHNTKPERLEKSDLRAVFIFLETVFSDEQQIPKELIPLTNAQQHWWCIREETTIVGTVAAWKEGNEWHWGRLAVDPNQRGKGLGKKLAIESFKDLFEMKIDEVVIDARDITVELLKSLGGKVTGPRSEFSGLPITQMKLRKTDFLHALFG